MAYAAETGHLILHLKIIGWGEYSRQSGIIDKMPVSGRMRLFARNRRMTVYTDH